METTVILSDTKDRAIRLEMTAVIMMTLAAVSACAAKVEIPKGFEEDALTVVRVFNDAVNARMVDTALSLVDDDVEFVDLTGEITTGKGAIRDWIQEQTTRNTRFEFCDIWVSGNEVVWTERVIGGPPQMAKNAAVVKRGKIKSLKVLADRKQPESSLPAGCL